MTLKAQWAHYAAKIDALTLRERAILFGSVIMVVGALADSLVLSPARAEQQQIAAKLTKLTRELAVLRTQVATTSITVEKGTPRGDLLIAIEQAQKAKETMDAQIKQSLASPDQMTRLPDLMGRVMRQQSGLTLSKLATASSDQDRDLLDKLAAIYGPVSGLVAPPIASGSASGVQPAAVMERGIRMQGVDVGISGTYLDLTRYLNDLERALPGLRWGELRLHAEPGGTAPPLMDVRVYLLGASS